ncbi:MAG: hypothetical protein ABSA53_02885 [Streptosporangiaceae bacterium]|jgi:hypothetical protein
MYDSLTFGELTALQDMLYEGTEKAYRVASFGYSEPSQFDHYRLVHLDIGRLFIEAGTELLRRIDNQYSEQAA